MYTSLNFSIPARRGSFPLLKPQEVVNSFGFMSPIINNVIPVSKANHEAPVKAGMGFRAITPVVISYWVFWKFQLPVVLAVS
ncbi:hypothetical protein [Flavobacterium cyanobacteriorum]|uniref:hypothetical protein n=1 Tax=Flavobacterium cyanobacteriorum TaxID=2022802 RepID=UPI0013FD7BAE|nr:hypothetical protein [Flavobacterium cyanobacteriorum]